MQPDIDIPIHVICIINELDFSPHKIGGILLMTWI